MMAKREGGFTIIELLITMTLFATVSTTFYYVLFSLNGSGVRSRNSAAVSQEARQGLNRLVRDTREANELTAVDTTIAGDNRVSYTIEVDFDANNVITASGPNGSGDLERLTYLFDRAARTVTLNGEVLMRSVRCVDDPTCATSVFTYSSNKLQYDWDQNGLVTWQELDEAGCPARGSLAVGNCNVTFDIELAAISNVDYAFQVKVGDSNDNFYAQAQLRNQR